MTNHSTVGNLPILTMPEADFGHLLGEVLSPSRPLQSAEYLRGREEQLTGIRKALYQPGRHVFIHGFRGVGKSSLAQTAAFALSTGGADPLILNCDSHSNFGSIAAEMLNQAIYVNPIVEKKASETGAVINLGWLNASVKKVEHQGQASEPGSINEAIRLTAFLTKHYTGKPVLVIDEFDQLVDRREQEMVANFIKQVSDRHLDVRFIFCGIGENMEDLMQAHGSADRYFHTVSLSQLPYDARLEIVDAAAHKTGMEVDDTTRYRIAKISDGFPHYVHLLTEKLCWTVYEAMNGGKVTGELFEETMSRASDAMEMKLKAPYEKATLKYSNDYEAILFAAADGHELKRRSTDIYNSYLRIMAHIGEPLDRPKFNSRMNNLKTERHGRILTANRAGWYEYTEKVLRGYARLRAEQKGIDLELDHPVGRKKIGWNGRSDRLDEI